MGIAIARAARRVARDVHGHGLNSRSPLAAVCAAALLVACQSAGAGTTGEAHAAAPRSSSTAQSGRDRPDSGERDHAFERIKGSWAYGQSCGWQHSASLEFLTESEGIVHGTWADGTRVRGESGELLGTWRDGKLFLRFCRIDVDDTDPQACPNYGAEDAYVVRSDRKVVWYRSGGGADYWKYLELHPYTEGTPIPVDDDCGEDG